MTGKFASESKKTGRGISASLSIKRGISRWWLLQIFPQQYLPVAATVKVNLPTISTQASISEPKDNPALASPGSPKAHYYLGKQTEPASSTLLLQTKTVFERRGERVSAIHE